MEILHEAEPVFCKGCNLVIAVGERFTVQVGDWLFHDKCWESYRREQHGCVGCGSHH